MPRTSPPNPIGDEIESTASKFFTADILGDELALKCRYAYVTAKIDAIQNRDEAPTDRLMQVHRTLEQRLKDEGVRPSSVLAP